MNNSYFTCCRQLLDKSPFGETEFILEWADKYTGQKASLHCKAWLSSTPSLVGFVLSKVQPWCVEGFKIIHMRESFILYSWRNNNRLHQTQKKNVELHRTIQQYKRDGKTTENDKLMVVCCLIACYSCCLVKPVWQNITVFANNST